MNHPEDEGKDPMKKVRVYEQGWSKCGFKNKKTICSLTFLMYNLAPEIFS
jgi:hypothetical protein